jgi:hypothetical protein
MMKMTKMRNTIVSDGTALKEAERMNSTKMSETGISDLFTI